MKAIFFIIAFVFSFTVFSQEEKQLKHSSTDSRANLMVREDSASQKNELKKSNKVIIIGSQDSNNKRKHGKSRKDMRPLNKNEDNPSSLKRSTVNDTLQFRKVKNKS
jgi:hypothetical protein